MSATLAVQAHRSHRWIYAALISAAIVAAIVLAFVFVGGNDAPAAPKPAPVVNPQGVDTGCVHAGPAMKVC
jgi:hypothetical protein